MDRSVWTRIHPRAVARVLVAAATLSLVAVLPSAAVAQHEGQRCSGEPTNERIEYGELRVCEINPAGDRDVFRFSAKKGEQFVIRGVDHAGPGPDPRLCLRLNAPGAAAQEACNFGIVQFTNVAPSDGEYTVEISEHGDNQTMAYTLVLESTSPPSPSARQLAPGDTLHSEVSPIGDLDLFRFAGKSGDRVEIRVAEPAPTAGPSPRVWVVSPSGSTLHDTTGADVNLLQLSLAETGDYIVAVSDAYDDQTMRYSVNYLCVEGACLRPNAPQCSMAMAQQSFTRGQPVVLQEWRIANASSQPWFVEEKAWIALPGRRPQSLFGDDLGIFWTVPEHTETDFGQQTLFRAGPPFPTGTYRIGCALLDPASGESIASEELSFDVQ